MNMQEHYSDPQQLSIFDIKVEDIDRLLVEPKPARNNRFILSENIERVKLLLLETSLEQLANAQLLKTVVEILEWMVDKNATHCTSFLACCNTVGMEPGRLSWYAVDSLHIGSPLFKFTAKRLVTQAWGYEPSLDLSD